MKIEKLTGKILAVTQPKEYSGSLQIGFKIQETWYNIKGTEDQLKIILDTMIKKGNEISFDFDTLGKVVSNITVLKESENESDWSEDMISFEDLLNIAHEKGIQSIKSEVIMIEIEKKCAVFKCTVTDPKGKIFEAHGDATMDNVPNKNIAPHFIRLAETRALARALRFYTNNGMVADVELTDKDKKEKKK